MNLETNKVNYYVNTSYRRRKLKRKTIVLGILWIFIIGIGVMSMLLPNNKSEVPYKDVGLVVNGAIIKPSEIPLIQTSIPLVALDDVKKYIDENILYDTKNDELIITTKTKVARIKTGEKKGTINSKPLILNNNIIKHNDKIFIPIDEFKEIYDIKVDYVQDANVIKIDTKNIIYNTGMSKYKKIEIKENPDNKSETIDRISKGEPVEIVKENNDWYKIKTDATEGFVEKSLIDVDRLASMICESEKKNIPVRKMPSIKQPIYKKLEKGEKIKVFGEVSGWYKVRTVDGIVGFVEKSHVKNVEQIPEPEFNNTKEVVWKPINGKINLVWEQVNYSTPKMHNIDKVAGLDVVSPTWFEIIKGDGTLKNKADSSYVTWARGNGYKIWGLISNGVSTDKMKMTSEFLNDSMAREKAINKLIYYANLYNLDGINVDFEHVAVEDKNMITQFLRELAPICKDKGLTLSIDVTVKVDSPNSLCFDRRSLGEIVDYLIVMTYDQYWATSPVSGSVAEYRWVEDNIKLLLDEVPKEKLIMGIPFYTRQWKEVANSKPESASITMANAKNIIRQHNAKVSWDEKSGQNYAEFYKNNAKYRIWLEDAKSIDLKSSLALKYDLAGVASWRRGYETYDVWNVLSRNLKQFKTYSEWENR